MMVYASNQPSQFDEAILDRVDEMVAFELPGPDERRKMIAQYMDRYLLNSSITTEDIGADEIEKVVELTEGFSGRAIAKLAIAWQAAAYGTNNATLNRLAFFQTVELSKKSMHQKDNWVQLSQQRADLLTSDQ